MKKTGSTILVFIVVAMLMSVANAATDENLAGQASEEQSEQLKEIEEYVLQRRQAIENYYQGQLTELRLRAKRETMLLEVAEKAVYSSLAAQAKVAETVLDMGDCLCGRQGYKGNSSRGLQNTIDKAPRRFATAQSRVVERKNDILAKLQRESLRLERQKRHALTVGLADLEKRLKENVLKPKPEPTHGVVTGIVYSAEKPSAAIDGVIVHTGDKIHSVKVTKIDRDSVEFEKNGKMWPQKPGEIKETFWQ